MVMTPQDRHGDFICAPVTRPLMGAYEKVSQEKLFSISKKYLFSYLRSPIVAYPWTTLVAPFLC